MIEHYTNGVLTERWDDATRTYTIWDEDGVPLTLPYTAEQIAQATERATIAAAAAARAAIRAAVKAIIVDLKLEKDRVQPVIDKANNLITGADTKDVARAAKRIADAAIELARFVQDTA